MFLFNVTLRRTYSLCHVFLRGIPLPGFEEEVSHVSDRRML